MSQPPPRHIVAVAGLVAHPTNGTVLLLRSPRRDWEFPGGQVEEGESLIEALHREIREETGVSVSVSSLVGVYSNTRSKIVMFGFLCEWTGGEPTTSPESLEVEWVSRDEARRRVTRPPLRDRLRDMLDFTGQVVYRSYAFSALDETGATEYVVQEERFV
ncbi:MAG: NUDIX hydrolase [Akkermansiaceae bacterium]|nr:NUDIX hydrolase [Armatimonadota bacterium]